jgi:hypothetical protein
MIGTSRKAVFAFGVILTATALSIKAGDQAGTLVPIRFNRDVLPILAENCFHCHGFDAKSREADLRLDVRDEAVANRDGIAAIVPQDAAKSLLIDRITTSNADTVMPPMESGKHLTADQVEILRRWIEEGAVYEKHWSFVAPNPSQPPAIQGVEHPIDRFIQMKLAEEQLMPSDVASPETLLRRVCLDLTGLPPSIQEIDDFLGATGVNAESAYRDLVQRKLADPHYGERWGRWWLDQARYADSNGYSVDAPRQIWKFRDWVVEALNKDMPFDQFTIEQLAGDLIPDATDSQKIATGFHRNTQINQEGGIDKEQFRIDSVFDRVATTGTVWLGLTVGCAQCHDHKFDPISQREFYRLFAFFNNQDEPTMKVYDPAIDVEAVKAEWKGLRNKIEENMKARAGESTAWEKAMTDAIRKRLSPENLKALKTATGKRTFDQRRTLFAAGVGQDEVFRALNEDYAELDELLNKGTTTLVMEELKEPRSTRILIKGDFTRPDEEVEPGTPSILHHFETAADSTSNPNRLDLAEWLTQPENPLTARVIVNRIWQQYFGRGLVESENDFGMLGSQPSHPELLDWLAYEFIHRGWSMKEMHQLILTSQTYRQSSIERADLRRADPNNYLLGRQRRIRLDGEIIRDVALKACGLMSTKMGGPPVFPPIPDGVMSQGQVKREWKTSRGEDRYRRGLYTFLYRATPPPSLNVFDSPDGFSPCTRRNRSNTPLQALTLLNDATFVEFAKALEKIIRSDGIETAFRRCTGRRPANDELAILEDLDTFSCARVLLNLDETITRE